MTVSDIPSKATGPLATRSYAGPPGAEVIKTCSNSPGYMTNMA